MSRLKVIVVATGLLALIGLSMLESSRSQAQGSKSCVTEAEAKQLALAYADKEFCQLPFETEEDRTICQDAKDRVDHTWFNTQTRNWVATLWEGYCAPAAQCWSGVMISCDGTVTPFQDGED